MSEAACIERQRRLIAALSASLKERHGAVECFETHLSWVLVAGGMAYKFKKAVRFDFVDFSELKARLFFCQEEVRLNRRLAPQIYLGVQAVGGDVEQPVFLLDCLPAFLSDGTAIEYCVAMRAFAQRALWTCRLQQGQIRGDEIDQLADQAAAFHLGAATAGASTEWGTPTLLEEIAQDNYAQFATLASDADAKRFRLVRDWSIAQQIRLAPVFEERKQRGFVRECHGDLHSGNIVTLNDGVQAFDCIEFNERLRWIDVINDIAFIYMDLQFRGRPDLAARCLSRYLERSGDYEGMRVLRYYQVQRALVRGKVALLAGRQAGSGTAAAAASEAEAAKYLRHAAQSISDQAAAPAIMITHGFSGSGKSVFARLVVECTGALQLRSDVERKRIHGMRPQQRGADTSGLYADDATARAYRRLLELTRMLVEAGMPVVVDAAFLRQTQRDEFRRLASELQVPFLIFDVHASEATMHARVVRREKTGSDASDAGAEVLAWQLRNHDPLCGQEIAQAIAVDTEAGVDLDMVRRYCASSHKVRMPPAAPDGTAIG